MADEEKGLDYYLANPEELPEHYSIEQLAALGEGKAVESTEDAAQSEEVSATDGTKAATEVPAEETKEAGAKDEEAPVQSKDGKHTIPYAVLSKEREQRRAAEAAIQELQEKLAALEQGAPKAVETGEQPISDEDLEALRDDFPALAATLEKLTGKIGILESQLAEERNRVVQDTAVKAQMTAQEAIDATPTLAYWQQENAEMFQTAIQFDDLLKQDPKNATLTLQERFEKVVAAVEAVHGKTDLPAAYRKDGQPKEDLAAKAKEVVDKTPASKPKTLSDLPGGTPPRSNELDEVLNMSPVQQAAMMQKMSPDQISELLSKLG